ncbi:putative LRR receptor-like serine/threonine-protein kinase IRK [Ananas comosus]|uniref:Putative LRR receptor-like serine/threonine-protein kinase IRK n=1 Tax=Ananas comosus TaxID=4615 RepID=A0A199UMV9_ANACO|nr:putative LRR receptor-like serine/threonine-protein kinase IRK [Ananas comosus]
MERAALLTFKAGIIDTSNCLSSWTGRDCCSWQGVVCDNNTGHVVKLNLQNKYQYDSNSSDCTLRGEINPSLLVLSHLIRLDLSGNDFGGISIPKFIGSLKSLKHLDLSNCGFSGKVPQQLGNLSNIRFLDLSCFYETCIFPYRVDGLSWLSHLSSLRYLALMSLDLSSAANWLQEVNKLKYLKVLRFSYCGLSNIPNSLSRVNFTNLQVLDIGRNGPFNTTLPTWLWDLTKLSYLDLGNSGFHGKIPDSLGNLISLKTLYLQSNDFEGSIPTSIQNLCNLVFVDLSSVGIGGDIAELAGKYCPWKNMETLMLGNNKLHGSLFGWLEEMKNLSYLDLSNNSLAGPVPTGIGRLSNLQILELSYNSLQGVISEAHFANLSKLKTLSLGSNSLIIDVDQNWTPPFQLSEISLGNHLTGMIPERLGDMRSLESLDLSLNELQGAIPQSLSALTFLNYLNLSYNNLSGRIPTGNQLSTLDDPSIYIGNTYLCGPPTGKNCSENETIPNIAGDDYDGSESTWLYVGMGLGFVAGFWGVCATNCSNV